MTVQELIDRLEKVEDKTLPVVLDWESSQVDEVYFEPEYYSGGGAAILLK